uniref:Uncharacterized protein LOC116954251 isoform X3 n=1 Tax=Petromyzon marinus TaxID=7757 RepID=A0AAJ7XE14_PETMA|nr:uncharacterized protein LOC116954251 isoform X3 [Petromyzon marinus]
MEAAKDAPRTQMSTLGNVAKHVGDQDSSSSYFNTAKEVIRSVPARERGKSPPTLMVEDTRGSLSGAEAPENASTTSGLRPAVCMYDVLFHQQGGYDAHLHRDDRQHSKSRGLNVHAEEMARAVPVLSSSEYGRQARAFVDPSDRKFARVGIVRAEFYRLNGASLQHTGSCQN